ncbi:nucleolar protein 4 [Plakobranchus ocellatus]|uniref:Nucleolar protein 4 n=1 Tax=Plakobranchus ocellatus TaxID=259542 RepID=A0AAV3YPD3_9GAST|nr:nucleolar protein 4 [Plakobranchus ocellatus]
MEKDSDNGELTETNISAFKVQFMNFVRAYCAAQNSSTITAKKKERIIKYLKNSKAEPNARFRFWTLFRRVPILDEFFDIIYAAHCENGHVGQAQTFSAVKAMYALIPRVMIVKFIEMCPQCSTSHIYMAKKRREAAQNMAFITVDKLAGPSGDFAVEKQETDNIQEEAYDESEDGDQGVDHQQDVDHALNELLSGKIPGSDMEAEDGVRGADGVGGVGGATVSCVSDVGGVTMGGHIEPEDISPNPDGLAFSCHLCKQVFNKRKALQKHIMSHQDYRPTVPLQKTSPQSKKRRFNVAFASSFLQSSPRRSAPMRKRVILDVDSSPTIAQVSCRVC